MKLRLKDRPLLAGFVGGLMSFALILSMGAQPSVYTWARQTFLIKGGPPVAADATARNIVGTTTTGQVPLNVQQRTAAGTDAFKVYAAGSYRLQVDSNGSLVLNGGVQVRYTAITPSASPGTGGAIIPSSGRTVLAVASAASASRHIMLPLASSYPTGQILIVIDAAGTGATETITVNRQSSDTINAAATTKTITAAYGALIFMTTSSTTWACWAWTPA